MTKIRIIETVEELTAVMPFLIQGFHQMNKKQAVFYVDQIGFVDTLIGVLNTYPTNIIAVAFDEGLPVGYGVAFEDTPAFAKEKHLLLWALYAVVSHSKHVAPMLYTYAENWAKVNGYRYMHGFNARFTGSSFKFFEQTLGMRRAQVKFTKKLL